MKTRIIFLLSVLVAIISGFSSAAWTAECVAGDTVAPGRITDFKALAYTATGAIFAFKVPNDASGVVAYDVRYRKGSALTALNWASSTQVTDEPVPRAIGNIDTLDIAGLSPSSTYYVGIKVQDPCGRWSTLSNVVIFTTMASYSKIAVVVNWNLNAESDLAGYYFYWGSKSRFDSGFVAYDFQAEVEKGYPAITLVLEKNKTYYFSVTAFNTSGFESTYSSEAGTDGFGTW